MTDLTNDLNKTITSAVEAQIHAKVLEALSGGEFFGKYINEVLRRPVEIKDPSNGYRTIQVAYIDNAIAGVIQRATEAAVQQAVEEEQAHIQDEVRKAVKRQVAKFAEDVAEDLLTSAKGRYGVKVEISVPGR